MGRARATGLVPVAELFGRRLISKLLTRNLCLSRSRIAPINGCSILPRASIFEPLQSTRWLTSIALQRAASGIDRVKRQQAERRGQPWWRNGCGITRLLFELKQRAAPRLNEVAHLVRSRRRRGRGTVAGISCTCD
jgi:hypothetical protein